MNAQRPPQGSAERLMSVLDVFTEKRLEWTPEELMERLGFSRPTLYRYLKVLREAGFLATLPGQGYTLGPRVVELDYLMHRSDPLVERGQPRIEALAARHPGTAFLVRWYGAKLLCVASACSIPDPISSYPRGRPMPLGRGAISRAILAHLPRRQQIALIRAHLAELAATGMGETEESVLASLREVRRAGVAVAHGEVTPGVIGIASPVFDASRAPVAALCLTIADTGDTSRDIEMLKPRVIDAAAEIGMALSPPPNRPETEEPTP